eukprot:TRINITY_DN594_c0_g1_i1.p1 TRINITY_DN594_c0_g1~~TRINITY_DN594_c0_g1_i1.p1  ORF type:complete len:424 (-),score=113.10 TRINITY_DN594_c0_g1_i1:52-1323(-)
MTRVIIVGAGISGLSAARVLKNAGAEILVIEGRDRVGGRVFSDPESGCDLGASWIHGAENNPITKLAKENSIELIETKKTRQLFAENEAMVKKYQELHKRFEEIYPAVLHDPNIDQTISVQDLVRSKAVEWGFDEMEKEIWEWFIDILFLYDGGPASVASVSEYMKSFLGERDLFIDGGYSRIVSLLAKDLKDDIKLNREVTRIAQTKNGVTVSGDHFAYNADYVIVTVSVGVLKGNSIQFQPELTPEKKKAIQEIQMGYVNKIAFWFPEQFWEPELGFFAYPKENRRVAMMSQSYVTHKPIVTIWAQGQNAKDIEGKTPEELEEIYQPYFKAMFGDRAVSPKKIMASNWVSDKFSKGSYSYAPPGVDHTQRDILAQNQGRYYFAGEALHRGHYGTVHAAYLTGIRAAQAILAVPVSEMMSKL